MTYSEAPEDVGVSRVSTRIMHATLIVKGGILKGSDFPDGMQGDPQRAVSISFDAPDLETGRALHERLKDGGAEITPFAKTFWSPGFGMVRDRFGTHWMISAPGEAQAH